MNGAAPLMLAKKCAVSSFLFCSLVTACNATKITSILFEKRHINKYSVSWSHFQRVLCTYELKAHFCGFCGFIQVNLELVFWTQKSSTYISRRALNLLYA